MTEHPDDEAPAGETASDEPTQFAWEAALMSDPHLDDLRERAADGDGDAIAELVELAGERGDLAELRRLADAGSSDAVDVMVELAGERGDLAEFGLLADAGNSDAADVLAELLEGET